MIDEKEHRGRQIVMLWTMRRLRRDIGPSTALTSTLTPAVTVMVHGDSRVKRPVCCLSLSVATAEQLQIMLSQPRRSL
jgi:hypothetical protein